MKIARSWVLGICACCNYNKSVDIGEKLVFCVLRIAERGSLSLQIVHFPFSMPMVYRLHPLHVLADVTQLRMLDLKVGAPQTLPIISMLTAAELYCTCICNISWPKKLYPVLYYAYISYNCKFFPHSLSIPLHAYNWWKLKSGTIHYLSDGLETLHYYARENSTIIVTPRSVPGNVWQYCYYTGLGCQDSQYGRLVPLWRLVGISDNI